MPMFAALCCRVHAWLMRLDCHNVLLWLRDLAAIILQQQFEAWKEQKRTTATYAWKVWNGDSGLWHSPCDLFSDDDERIGQGTLVDLLACEQATD